MKNKLDSFKTSLLVLYLIQTSFDGGGGELIQQALSSFLILTYWFITLTAGEKSSITDNIRIPPNAIPYAVFLIIAALSIITSVDISASSWVYFYWINQSLFFLAVYNHLRDREIYNKILEKVIFPFSVIVSSWGLLEFIAGNPRNTAPLLRRGPSQAMFEQPNSTAGFLVVIIVILFSAFLTEKDKIKRKYTFLFLMISTAALIGTYSRAGWITLISCLLIYFILLGINYFRKNLWKLTTFVAGTAIVFVIMASMPRANLFYRAKLIVHDNYLPHNISDRMDIWTAAWRLGANNPLLGTGIGTYHLTYLSEVEIDRNFRNWTAHNDYLQFFSETGIFGALSIIIALGLYVWFGFRLVMRFRKSAATLDNKQLFSVGLYTASLAPLIHSIVDFDLRTPGVFALFLFINAYIWHEVSVNKIIKDKFYKPGFKFLSRIRFKVLISLIALVTFYFIGNTFLADFYYKIALNEEKKKNFDAGIRYAQKASELKRGVADYNEFLARNYSQYALTASDEKVKRESALKSEREYLLAIDNSRMVPDYYLGLATLYEKKRILFKPVRLKVEYLYNKAMETSPSDNFLKFKFAELMMQVGSYETAIKSLESTQIRGRILINGLTLLAEAYRLSGDLERADSTLSLKLSREPDDGFANFIKAEILEDMNRLEEAIPHYLKALKQSDSGNRFQVLLRLGKAYFSIGKYDTALLYLHNALKLNKGERNTLMLLSQTYGAMGNYLQSAAYYKKVIE